MQASVIIRAKNEAKDIGETLDAVFAQRDVAGLEVILVDSGSSDGTVEIAQRFPVQVIEIPPHEFTYGHALNLGIRAARGEFTIALSAHSLPANDRWLAELLAPFSDPTVGGVYGRHLPRTNVSPPELFGMHLSGVTSTRPRRQTRDMMFSNANGAHRRSLVLEHPFDEKIPGAEDLAWADWILRNGWAVYYQPTAPVYHSHGESLLKLVHRMVHDQPTIWGLKLGLIDRRVPPAEAPHPVFRD